MKVFKILLVVTFLGGMACKQIYQKDLSPAPIKGENVSLDTLHDIRHTLENEGRFTTFLAAMHLTGFDTLILHSKGNYTIFAPTDSVFASQGITATNFSKISSVSLAQLVAYHIVKGRLSDSILQTTPGYITAGSLRSQIIYEVNTTEPGLYRYYLYLHKEASGLQITGKKVNNGEKGLYASNGYVYGIHSIVHPPDSTIIQVLNSRPEFSDFKILLSIRDPNFNLYASLFDDSGFGSVNGVQLPDHELLVFRKESNFLATELSSTGRAFSGVTVFAPTNLAFTKVSFIDPLLVKKSLLDFQKKYSTTDPIFGNTTTPLDTITQGHLLSGAALFYSDLKNGSLNRLKFSNNGTILPGTSFQAYYNQSAFFYANSVLGRSGSISALGILKYSVVNNLVQVGWGGNLNPTPANITQPDIICVDGIIHGVDRFFSPNH